MVFKTFIPNKFYFRFGILLGAAGTLIGLLGFIMRFWLAGDRSAATVINYSLCLANGLAVIVTTLFSAVNPGLRYYSKQLQTMLLYLTGAIVLANSGDLGGIILFIVGLVLAYRYSFLVAKMLLFTALFNCILLATYAALNELSFIYIVHELIFVIFTYTIVFLIYRDYSNFLNRKIRRLNTELDMARRIIPFGAELKKRIESTVACGVDFTKKEYELMTALCFYNKISNDELSEFMSISVATVKSHLNNIYKKTGIHSRSRLIVVYKDIFVDRRSKNRPVDE